jgi:hypothetical protein
VGPVSWFDTNDGAVVELWVHDTPEGQSVTVVGEHPDGQRFFGSFFQPSLNNEEEDQTWQ